MGSGQHRSMRQEGRTGLDSRGLSMPREVQSLCYVNSPFLSLSASSFPFASQPSLHRDAPKTSLEILFWPNFSHSWAGLGSRYGTQWLCSDITQRRCGFSPLLHLAEFLCDPGQVSGTHHPLELLFPHTISLSTLSHQLLKICRLK